MYLRTRVEEILASAPTETQLLGLLTQLILEYDCDRNFHAGDETPPVGSSASCCGGECHCGEASAHEVGGGFEGRAGALDIPPRGFMQRILDEPELNLVYEN